jgi:NarL family two-component system response regulator YdfI
MSDVLLISEHGLLRQGLSRLLRETDSFRTVHEVETGEEALERIRLAQPAVILLHVSHPVGKRMRVLHLLREKASDIPVLLLLDVVNDDVVVGAMQAGAAGCLDKNMDARHLILALQDAVNGEIALSDLLARRLARIIGGNSHQGKRQPYQDSLTQREMQVLALLAQGLSNREIARSLFVSESTVRAHLRTVTQKLGVHNRVHAVARALELGMVSISDPAEGVTSIGLSKYKAASIDERAG